MESRDVSIYSAFAEQAFAVYEQDKSPASKERQRTLIQEAMKSENSEFLVELGDQLAIGLSICQDLSLAEACFRKAMCYSELMGCYALGRLYFGKDKIVAKDFFERAAKLGHLLSYVYYIGLSKHSSGQISHLFRQIKFSWILFESHMLLERKPDKARIRYWRYRDSMKPNPLQDRILGADRNFYFSWTRPMDVRAFSDACKRTHP